MSVTQYNRFDLSQIDLQLVRIIGNHIGGAGIQKKCILPGFYEHTQSPFG
jgi:hypothetical protein